MTYDLVGRLASRSGPGFPSETFRYDTQAGQWRVAVNSLAYDSLVLDARGRLSSVFESFNNRNYLTSLTYDTKDRVTGATLTQKSGSTTLYTSAMSYVYLANTELPDSVCANGKCLTLRRTSDLLADTVIYNRGGAGSWKITQAFDSAHALTGQTFSPVSLAGMNVTWWRDSLQRVLKRTSPDTTMLTRTFSYDNAGQLLQATDSNGSFQYILPRWGYDAGGNRTRIVADDNNVYGPGDRLQRDVDYGTYTHDANGGIICNGPYPTPCNGRQYTWDGLGRLTQVTNGGTVLAAFAYDALGRRIKKSFAGGAEWYAHLGDQVALDVDSTNNSVKVEYNWLSGMDQLLALKTASVTAAAIRDPNNGTVRGLAQFSGGSLIKRYPEFPWGDIAADSGLKLRMRFAGLELDVETELYYVRARYYDPKIGRFISEDPIGIGGGLNVFAYAGNDPINQRDPSGLMPPDPCADDPFCTVAPYPRPPGTPTYTNPWDDCGFDTFQSEYCSGRPIDTPQGPPFGGGGGGESPANPEAGLSCGDAWKNLGISGALDLGTLVGVGGAIRAYRYGSMLQRAGVSIFRSGGLVNATARANSRALYGAGTGFRNGAVQMAVESIYNRGMFSVGYGASGVSQGLRTGDLDLGRALLDALPIVGSLLAIRDVISSCHYFGQ